MRQYPKSRYQGGTYKRECDRCGFDFLRNELQKEADTNAIVCDDCLDEYDPQKHIKKRIREKPFRRD